MVKNSKYSISWFSLSNLIILSLFFISMDRGGQELQNHTINCEHWMGNGWEKPEIKKIRQKLKWQNPTFFVTLISPPFFIRISTCWYSFWSYWSPLSNGIVFRERIMMLMVKTQKYHILIIFTIKSNNPFTVLYTNR
jgi:hypothetical protein